MKRLLLLVVVAAAGCMLEKFEKVTELCGMPPSSSAECLACVSKSTCCEKAAVCAANASCAPHLGQPVTPASIFDPSYDDALGCLQTECDAACGISWGCLDGYDFDAPAQDSASTLYLHDSATELEASGLEVRACDGTDPLCLTGTVLGTTDPSGALGVSPAATYADYYRISQPGSDPGDPLAYVPTNTRWSEHVMWVGPATTYVFRRSQVASLVTVSNNPEVYDPAKSHLVFWAHNCLPMRHAFQGRPPYAQAEGVEVRLEEPNLTDFPVIYTGTEALPDPSLARTSRVGSGGAIGLQSERNVAVLGLRNGRVYTRAVINAPKGGLGIVHLVPTPTR